MKTQVFCKSVFSLSKKFLVVFGPKLDAIATWGVWTLNNYLFSKTTVNPLRKKMVKKWSKFWSKNPPSSCGLHPSSCVKIFFFLTQQSTYLNFLCFHFFIVFIFCPKINFEVVTVKFYCRIHCKPKWSRIFGLGPTSLATTVEAYNISRNKVVEKSDVLRLHSLIFL